MDVLTKKLKIRNLTAGHVVESMILPLYRSIRADKGKVPQKNAHVLLTDCFEFVSRHYCTDKCVKRSIDKAFAVGDGPVVTTHDRKLFPLSHGAELVLHFPGPG